MHPYDIHIKFEYEYEYPYLCFMRIRIQIIRMFSHPDPSLDTRSKRPCGMAASARDRIHRQPHVWVGAWHWHASYSGLHCWWCLMDDMMVRGGVRTCTRTSLIAARLWSRRRLVDSAADQLICWLEPAGSTWWFGALGGSSIPTTSLQLAITRHAVRQATSQLVNYIDFSIRPPPAVIAGSDDFGSRHDSSNVLKCVFVRRRALSPVDETNASERNLVISLSATSFKTSYKLTRWRRP